MFHSLPRRTNRFSCIIGQSLSVARTLSLCFAVFRVCLDRQRTGTLHAYSSAQILLDFQGTAECTTRFPKIYEMAASTSQNVDPRKRKSGPSAPDAYSKRRQTDAASNSVATKSKTGQEGHSNQEERESQEECIRHESQRAERQRRRR
jgi:hypothetical protein